MVSTVEASEGVEGKTTTTTTKFSSLIKATFWSVTTSLIKAAVDFKSVPITEYELTENV